MCVKLVCYKINKTIEVVSSVKTNGCKRGGDVYKKPKLHSKRSYTSIKNTIEIVSSVKYGVAVREAETSIKNQNYTARGYEPL